MKKTVILIQIVVIFLSGILYGQQKTENVFLITIDGLRWQELFTGAEKRLIDEEKNWVKDAQDVEAKFWRESPQERREALMPFFWRELVKHGIVYGNRHLESDVKVTNDILISYPGYAEILTGFSQNEITSNKGIQNPSTTILEFLKNELVLEEDKIAAFASWDVIQYIVSKEPGAIFCNAGFQPVYDEPLNETQQILNILQSEMPRMWKTVRYDAFTYYQGMEYLKKHKPRIFYFSFGETDDAAHDRRYDHVLEAAHRTDKYLMELWHFAQADTQYRNKTTFVITSDHGRGSGEADEWASHRKNIEGSDFIWIAVIGPDTPNKGELSKTATVYQKDIASTIAALFGLDFSKVAPDCGPPLPLALQASSE